MANIAIAIKLLVIGMTSVFLVLCIVIYLGKALTFFINKFAPEETTNKATSATAPAQAINPKHLAAIQKAIAMLTSNQGQIQDIKKA